MAAHQAPPSLGFSRQEHWSGLPFPSPMHESEKGKWSRSVVSDSVRPHGLQPTRLLRPWDFPGKSTGVGCHCLLWTTPTAVKVAGIVPWIHHEGEVKIPCRPKKQSGLQRGTPLTLERLRSSLRRRKRRSWTSPFRMKQHNQLLLLGLINVILNLTSIPTQDVFISWAHFYEDFHNTSNCWVCRAMPLSVMDGLPWWVSLLCQWDFKPLCSFLGWQKETFLSLVNHNLSLLSCCKTYRQ